MQSESIIYKSALIIPHERGVDIVNPVTGKWKYAKSVHAAKWHITLYIRLNDEWAFLLDTFNPNVSTPLNRGVNNQVAGFH